jgi:catechol 2,3-dioxygenase-like lactoylglutathione lyase family enzyme
MSLSDARVRTSVAVSDLAQAASFYEEKLGLSAIEDTPESRVYACGGDTALHVYVSPTGSGAGTSTLATFYVGDLGKVVDDLTARGVAFERYEGLATDAKGIHDIAEGGRVAWFKDPDGNTFAIEE